MKLNRELETLFTDEDMIQIQVDYFIRDVERVRDDLQRIFKKNSFSIRQVQWAIDTKVQQGNHFPPNRDIMRIREEWARLSGNDERRKALLALIDWYSGLSFSVDQFGVYRDRDCNVLYWPQKINTGISQEQADLLNLTFLNSRTAQVQGGRYQALTFQRRVQLTLEVGSVGATAKGIPSTGCIGPKVPQPDFTKYSDKARIRAEWARLSSDEERRNALLALVDWYRGLSFSVGQDRVSRDQDCNVLYWRKMINEDKISQKQAESLNETFLTSRTKKDRGGFDQARTFELSVKDILGVGSVEGKRTGIPVTSSCIDAGAAAMD
jgi:hypothetical protein